MFTRGFWIVIFCIAVIGGVGFLISETRSSVPGTVLWAWQRPENFSFLEGKKDIGVAYLAGSAILQDGRISAEPRLQSLFIPKDIPTIAVVRIDNHDTVREFTGHLDALTNFVVHVCGQKNIGCQIDFDARTSEYEPYKLLLTQVVRALPGSMSLSATALVSWCGSASWLRGADFDFVVPQYYSMGPEGALILKGVVGNDFMRSPACAKNVGLSLDEQLPPAKFIKGKNVWLFSPTAWTAPLFSDMLGVLKHSDE